jgi:hypothetical protein
LRLNPDRNAEKERDMKTHDDIIDLGSAQDETHGALPAGQQDVQPGDKFILGGISADD